MIKKSVQIVAIANQQKENRLLRSSAPEQQKKEHDAKTRQLIPTAGVIYTSSYHL